jgi:hypothetical protein
LDTFEAVKYRGTARPAPVEAEPDLDSFEDEKYRGTLKPAAAEAEPDLDSFEDEKYRATLKPARPAGAAVAYEQAASTPGGLRAALFRQKRAEHADPMSTAPVAATTLLS